MICPLAGDMVASKDIRWELHMDFIAIDFETANHRRHSACAVGIVTVRDGKVVDRFSTLIRPRNHSAKAERKSATKIAITT